MSKRTRQPSLKPWRKAARFERFFPKKKLTFESAAELLSMAAECLTTLAQNPAKGISEKRIEHARAIVLEADQSDFVPEP